MKRFRNLMAVVLLLALSVSVVSGNGRAFAKSFSSLYWDKYDGKKFKGTSDSVLLQGHGKCTVDFLDKKGRKIVINVKLFDTGSRIFPVNNRFKVRMYKLWANNYFGSFRYESGRTSCDGIGKIWLKNGRVYLKLGLTNGEPPIFPKKRLKRRKR